MTVKLTGTEWNRFYADKESWPEDAWHEDEELTIDGAPPPDDFDLSAVPDAAKMTLAGGYVFRPNMQEGPSVETLFNRWRKKQATAVLMVEVPHDKADAVRAAIAAAGGKVLA